MGMPIEIEIVGEADNGKETLKQAQKLMGTESLTLSLG